MDVNISNAMVYVVQGNNPESGQVVFGSPMHREPGSERKPAYGNGTMRLVVLNTAPRVPDLVQRAKSPMPGQELRSLTFNFSGEGEMYDMTGGISRARVSVSSTSPFMSGFPGQEAMTAPVAYSSITVESLE